MLQRIVSIIVSNTETMSWMKQSIEEPTNKTFTMKANVQ